MSVIMPVYNVERYVDTAIDSVLAQKGVDYELVVVNDGSTDGTGDIVHARAQSNSRIRVVDQANSGRPSIARNRGMHAARGAIITFLDGDDIFLPGKLERTIAAYVRHPEVGIVFHDLKRMSESGELLEGTYLSEFKFPEHALEYMTREGADVLLGGERFYSYASSIYCPLMMCSTTIRRRLLESEAAWFREDMRCGEDIDLWFRLLAKTRAVFIQATLGAYRYRPDSTTQDREDFLLGTLRAHRMNLERAASVLTPVEKRHYVRRIAERYQHLGYYYVNASLRAKARWSYVQSFKVMPSISALVRYLKTWIPDGVVRMVRTRKRAA